MDFSKLLPGFVKIDTWIFLSCYMDLSKLRHGFALGTWSEKKRDYVGKNPKGGEGSDPNPLHICPFFPIQGFIKWQKMVNKL